jgi:hypothetical protein
MESLQNRDFILQNKSTKTLEFNMIQNSTRPEETTPNRNPIGQSRTGDINNIKNTQSLINTRSSGQSIENPKKSLNPNSTISKSIHKITGFIYLEDFS